MGFFGNVGRAISNAFTAKPKAPRIEDSPRFQRLQEFERTYWGEQYDHRGLSPSWDKLTPGRYVPLRSQKPSTQYDLPRLIVDRPTSMLFGEGRFPELELTPLVEGQDVTDVNKWLSNISEEGDLPHCMLIASRQGARLGSAVITWSLVEGEFDFEPHLAIFCKPTFHPRKRRQLTALEKRYKFKREVEVMSSEGVRYQTKDFWHRETWDENSHIVYVDCLVPVDGSEPFWEIADQVDYGYGRCPAVWIKNLDDADPSDIDGVSLLEGLGDMTEDIDRTLSQKSRAVRYNQDPERVYFGLTKEMAASIKIGGGATTILPAKPGADVELLELQGEGQRIAEEHVISQRGRTLETARVIAPDSERLLAAARSGAAMRILFSPMLELVGEMRTSYGRGLRDMLFMILDLARRGKLVADGFALATPPPASIPDGKLKNLWGRFFEPTVDDLSAVATAMQTLSASGLLDHETILHIFASYLGIKDVAHVMQKAQAEAEEKSLNEQSDMMGMPRAGKGKGKPKPAKDGAPEGEERSKSATAATDDGQ